MSTRHRRAVLFAIIPLLPSMLFAQKMGTTAMDGTTPPGIAVGAPAGSYALSGFENVDLFSGNLDFHLPLVTIKGRGEAQYTMTLTITVTTGTTTLAGVSKNNQAVDAVTTGPQGSFVSRSKHYFYGAGNDPNAYGPVLFSYPFWADGREYQTDELDSAGTALRSTVQTWQQRPCEADERCLTVANDASNNNIRIQGAENSPVDPRITASQVTLMDVTPNLTSSKSFSFDRYNNETQVTESDYGGATLRTTATSYITTNSVNQLDYTAIPIFLRHPHHVW